METTFFLDSVYNGNWDENISILYQLLSEREDYESISHNDMPTVEQHTTFIRRNPYKAWYIVYDAPTSPVGSIYLSYGNEIGIAIFKKHRRKGYGKKAIETLMQMHSSEKYFLANINPTNDKSILLFRDKLGFKHIQNTYRLGETKLTPEQYDTLTGKNSR